MLGLDEFQELVLQGQEVAADLCRVQLVVLPGKVGLDVLGDAFVGGDLLVGVLALAYFLVTFAPWRCFSSSLCWGEKKLVWSRNRP